MVRKMVRTAATTLAVASMFTMSAFAADWNTQGGTAEVEGTGNYVEPVIEVELPGDLSFGINPLQLDANEDGTTDPQIVTSDYIITNYGNVPVAITAETTAAVGGKVELQADASYDTKTGDLASVDTKNALWLVQLYPKEIKIENGEVKLTVEPIDFSAKQKNADIYGQVIKAAADGVDPAKVKFLLEAHNDTASCIGAFQFSGAVDPNAAFDENDTVSVKTKFTLNTVSANQKTKSYAPLDLNSKTYAASVVKDAASN